MSTFVVRFVAAALGAFRGKVRHVRTGEEGLFSSPSQLLFFFELMNAGSCADSDVESPGEVRADEIVDGVEESSESAELRPGSDQGSLP